MRNTICLSDVGLYLDWKMCLRDRAGNVLIERMPANFELYRVGGESRTLTGEPIERYRLCGFPGFESPPDVTLRRIGSGLDAFWDVPQAAPVTEAAE